jgi:hypothetical protein
MSSHRIKTHKDFLIRSSISKTTNNKYDKALTMFKQYLSPHKLHHMSPHQLDSALCNYIHHLYICEKPLSTAINTISVVKRTTGYGSLLHKSNLSIKGWNKLYQKHRKKYRPPLTIEVTTLIAVVLAKSGHYNAALATLVAFHALLRINELCTISIADIVFRGDSRIGDAAVNNSNVLATIKLPHTKTGDNQYVTIVDSDIAQLLKQCFDSARIGVNSSALLFGMSTSKYRSLFKLAVTSLGLGHCNFTPHSLRHGGATLFHLQGGTVQDLMVRGRWKSQSALSIYVQTGAVLLFDTTIDPQLYKAAQVIRKHLMSVMNSMKNM